MDYLKEIIKKNKEGKSEGITSICSANSFVIEAAILNAKKNNSHVLIESTSNQVNQFGGYTGMRPEDFKNAVYKKAEQLEFPAEKIILGGDHLGPNTWQDEVSDEAMKKAEVQISDYVKAGFTKIHLDTSMKCRDDADKKVPLETGIIAERAAILCKASESSFKNLKERKNKPVYIIGSDVPLPGGEIEEQNSIRITPSAEVDETIELTRKAFCKYGLEDAWSRSVAVVVQPGVEFSNSEIFEYDPDKTRKLVQKIQQKENMVYEAHSTDYQRKKSLKKMVENHFAILKVGPWLTFAFREAVFALAKIEEEYFSKIRSNQTSNIFEVIEEQMKNNPKYWEKYYEGDENQKSFFRKYSFSDRIRYYWSNENVKKSLQKLINNLSENKIPLTLISQYLPDQYYAIRKKEIQNNPKEIIYHKINEVLEIYNYATSGGTK